MRGFRLGCSGSEGSEAALCTCISAGNLERIEDERERRSGGHLWRSPGRSRRLDDLTFVDLPPRPSKTESPSFKTLFEPSALSSALLLCSSTPAARLRAEPRRVSKLSSSGSEVDDFFTKRPRHVPSPTAPPPKRRRQVPTSDR